MYNDALFQNRIKRIAIIAVIIAAMITVLVILLTPFYKGFSLHRTPYVAENLASVQGDAVYSYSGATFYKSPLASPASTTVLSSGFHLPQPSSIRWAGDNGALMQFTDQGLTGSLVESELTARGLVWGEDTEQFVWFFDFKSRSLQLIDMFGVSSDAYYYSESEKGFYYGAYKGSRGPEFGPLVISFYSIENRTSKIVSETADSEATITYIGSCGEAAALCFIKDDGGTFALYSATTTPKKLVNDTYSYLVPTGSASVFIGSVNEKPQLGEENEGEMLPSDMYYIDLSSGKRTKILSRVAANTSLITNTGSDESFYIVKPTAEDDEFSFYTGAKDTFKTPKTKKATFTNIELDPKSQASLAILPPVSYNENGYALFRDTNSTYLISPKEFTYQSPQVDSSEAERLLKPCFDTHTKEHAYSNELKQFKVSIVYDANYRKNIEAFSNCVASKNPGSLLGYGFIYIGVSPIDGRFMTN